MVLVVWKCVPCKRKEHDRCAALQDTEGTSFRRWQEWLIWCECECLPTPASLSQPKEA